MTILTFSLLNICVIALLSSLIPAFTRPDLFFAVTVPTGFRQTAAGRRIVRRYVLYGWAGTALLTILVGLFRDREAAGHLAVAGVLVVWLVAFLVGRHLAMPHAVAPDPVRIASLSVRHDKLPGGMFGVGLPFVVLAVRGLECYLRWDQIPDPFPVHWGLQGPDRWADRTPMAVYGSLGGVALICAVMLWNAWALTYRSRQVFTTGDNAVPERRFRRYGVISLIALAWIFAITLPPIPHMRLVVPYAPFLILAASVVLIVTLAMSGQGGTRLPEYQSLFGNTAPAGDGTPDSHWKLGMIYFNREDPALIVEKRFGLGWTLNFGNPWCWVVTGGLLCWPLFRMLMR